MAAAVFALFVAWFFYCKLNFKQLNQVYESAAKTTAVVMFLVAAAVVSAWLITVSQLQQQLLRRL